MQQEICVFNTAKNAAQVWDNESTLPPGMSAVVKSLLLFSVYSDINAGFITEYFQVAEDICDYWAIPHALHSEIHPNSSDSQVFSLHSHSI